MDETGTLNMSSKELNRLEILGRVLERRLTQVRAAEQLGLGVRQVERLCRKLRIEGPSGLVSKKRGRVSNRRLPSKLRERAVGLVQSCYSDFGPTLAAEKLRERHDVIVSVETLRRWMIDEELWVPRSQRDRRVYQPRHRRSCIGELIQIDGCDHAWFEDRGPKCTLLVYVDDATSQLIEIRFVASESTFDYFASTKSYLDRHGKPVALYSDRASIFRVTGSGMRKDGGSTQLSRALSELNIDIVCANTPQAKGRVERAHLTLQDRLVKELRLRGISTPEAANAYAPEFMAGYNERFGKQPMSDHNAHRPVRDDEDLALIFTWQEDRKISKALTLHYRRGIYLIEPGPETLELRGQRCRVHAYADGHIEFRHGGRSLPFRAFDERRRVTQGDIVSNKRLGAVLEKIQADQRKRDEEFLANPKVTLREKQRIRTARAQAGMLLWQAPERSPTRHFYFVENPTFLTWFDSRKRSCRTWFPLGASSYFRISTTLTLFSEAEVETYPMAPGFRWTKATTSASERSSGGGTPLPEKIIRCQWDLTAATDLWWTLRENLARSEERADRSTGATASP